MIGKVSFYSKAVNSMSGKDVRISKRAYIPSNKLRGFESGKVGPIDNSDFIGGNYVTTLNLSTTLPQILPSFENTDFSFFIDAANIWGVDHSSTAKEHNTIRSSVGVGVDFLTPVGPLSFSLSQPISKASSDKTETFRFNLGTSF
jgi:outer membrane protein insertion porin family